MQDKLVWMSGREEAVQRQMQAQQEMLKAGVLRVFDCARVSVMHWRQILNPESLLYKVFPSLFRRHTAQ